MNGISIIVEDPTPKTKSSACSQESRVRPRRYHTKSRKGCLACKQKRIKCDENHPECNTCWQKGIRCHYLSTASNCPAIVKEPQPSTPKTTSDNYFTESTRTKILHALKDELDNCEDEFQTAIYKLSSDAFPLLHHFLENKSENWIGSSRCQKNQQAHGLALALEATYLLHAILAFSAGHLSYLYPRERKYSIAATFHYQRALQHYHRHFDTELRENDADAMMACSILLSLLAFVHTTTPAPAPTAEEADDRESSACSSSSKAPSWVRSMQATQILLRSPTLYRGLCRGIWVDLVRVFEEWKADIFGGNCPDLVGSTNCVNLEQVRALSTLCAETYSVEKQEVYKTPLFLLEYLAQLPPDIEYANRFVYFINTLSTGFLELLDAEDALAMMIIAFWCGLLNRIEHWCICLSAARECRRLCEVVVGQGDERFGAIVGYLDSLVATGRE